MYEIIKMKNSSRRRFIKRAARKMLYSDWVGQIIAFMIVGCCFIAINYFGTSCAFIVNELTDNVLLLEAIMFFYIFFSILFTVPLLYGLLNYEVNAISGEKGKLTDIFDSFSSFKNTVRTYSLFLQSFGRLLLCLLPAAGAYVFKEFFYENGMLGNITVGGIDVIMFLLNTVFVLLLYLGITVFSGCFVAIYLTVKRKDVSVDENFYKARFFIIGNRKELTKMTFSFLLLFVVSLFSMGFLFVLYTLPYMLISILMTAKYICDKQDYIPEAQKMASHNFSE